MWFWAVACQHCQKDVTGECVDTAVSYYINGPMQDYLDALDALPPCTPVADPDGAIDLTLECAGGACAGADYPTLVAAVGEGVCAVQDAVTATCAWDALGLTAPFADLDNDGLPDVGSRAQALELRAPSTWATTDGLALGVSMRCPIETYGQPTTAKLDDQGDITHILSATFVAPLFDVDDLLDSEGVAVSPDGYIDAIRLYPFTTDTRGDTGDTGVDSG